MAKVLIVSSRDLGAALGDTVLWAPDVERLVASSPGAAFEVTRSFVPSLVVVDGADAPATLELVRLLRESRGTRRASIVVVEPAPALSEEELCRAGANLVLRPPVDPADWDEALQRLLSGPRRVRTGLSARFVPRAEDGRPGASVAGLALDVSLGGLLLEAPSAPEAGAMLDVFLTLPDGPEEWQGVGKAVWVSVGPPARTGIQLLALEPEARDRLRRLLASPPDRSFGRYEVVDLLGEGSMGRVYRGFDPLARRPVAIKTPRPEYVDGPESPEYLRRFRREAQAAARLVHPNVITIFDVGDDYFVMELLEGTTLQAMLRTLRRLGPDEVRRILAPVADALDYAHSQGTIHRDIKPGNIMVQADGRPKVMDFGVAHLTFAAITADGQFVGSPAYMAPEQIRNSEATPATDRFSLAVVAYEALTGRKPFEGDGVTPILYKVLSSDPPPPTSLNPTLPPAYDEIFRRALAKDPAARFDSARALVAALAQGQSGEEPSLVTTPVAYGSAGSPPAAPREPLAETMDLRDAPVPEGGRRSGPSPRLWSGGAALAAALGVVAVGASPWGSPVPLVIASPPGLQISTAPAGASVLLGGIKVGNAPLFLPNLPAGIHAIKVLHEGYAPAELAVETTGDGPPVPLRFTLQPLTATLRVEAQPAGEVEVDGKVVGGTPLTGHRLAPGVHRVVIKRAGFRPWLRTVDAGSGETVKLQARLVSTRGPGSPEEAMRAKSWVRVGDLVELGPGVTAPRRVAGRPASYPEAARRLRLKGSVTVEMLVSEQGDVLQPRVVESAGEVLDEALLIAVRDWRYAPAEANGVKVRVRIQARQTFG
jgi:serine/threonine-protein kinase